MNILFDKDINLFDNHSYLQVIRKLPYYKKHYKPIFLNFISELNFDSDNIDSIYIMHNKTSYGTTKHYIKENKIYFIIELLDEIIPFVSNTQNSLDTFKAKSIVQHEICHCIEMKQLYDSHCLREENPLNDWHECPNVEDDLKQLDKWISATKFYLEKHEDIKLCEDMLYFLHSFWYHMISVIAVYLHNHESILIANYENTEYEYVSQYFTYIYQRFKHALETYPGWVSEDGYISLGKSLMKMLEFNQITYSSDDLSDNFIFKFVQ